MNEPALELHFALDQTEIKALLESEEARVPSGDLNYSHLWMPVRFAIGGVRVLDPDVLAGDTWLIGPNGEATLDRRPDTRLDTRKVPVLFFAQALQDGLSRLRKTGAATVTVPDGGSIGLRAHRGRVDVTAEDGTVVRIGHDELQAGVDAFWDSVATMVTRDLAALKDHPDVGWWFASRDRTES